MSETLAYIAGIIDGEGYIGVHVRLTSKGNLEFRPRVAVAMTERQAIDLIRGTLGGRPFVEHKNRKRPLAGLRWSCQQAAEVCRMLLPWLKVKKNQARLLMRLAELRKVNRNCGRLIIENRAEQERITKLLAAMKKSGNVGMIDCDRPIPKLVRPVRHGTRFGYKQGCRCARCNSANARHSREIRRMVKRRKAN